jgi:predicted short-subunit dehydrogenase-like oxidoreductase (DUF2520 family)
MDIVIIGSGNVATILGRLSFASGHRIRQVYSRSIDNAAKLAALLDADPVTSMISIDRDTDLTIIALSDQAISPFLQSFGETKSIVVHTAGSVAIQELQTIATSYGVLYPMQSLRKEMKNLPEVTLLVNGSDRTTLNFIRSFAETIAENVLTCDDQDRQKYHLAAILVNNFVNHLYTLTAEFCENEHISFSVLQPLITETVNRLRFMSPSTSQTGPAKRNDQETIHKHLQLLTNYPDIAQIYKIFSKQIVDFYAKLKP